MRSYFFILLCFLLELTASSQTVIPDKILFNGNIITMNPDNPRVTSIALKEDRILELGFDEQILGLGDESTLKIDLDETTILPGFVDAHNHLFNDVELTDEGILRSQQLMFENGITTFGNMFSNDDVIAHVRSMDERGLIKIKASIYLPAVNNCGDVLDKWWMNYPPTRNPGEKVRIGGVKIFTDGGTCEKLPAISWTYLDRDSQGDLFFDQETLNGLVTNADEAGYQLAIHAQGDRAIRQTIQALSMVTSGTNEKRHRIEHNSFIPADIYNLYGANNIVPVTWGYYFTCSIEGLANVFGMENLLWLEDWRSIIDANPGIPIAWHSDAPILPLNPIINLHSSVTKEEVAGDGNICTPPEWLAEHAMTVEEGLKFMTIHSAYALDRDQEVGSLKSGKFADLVLLSNDPTQMNTSAIKSIEILATMADGNFVYCSDRVESICNAAITSIKLTHPNNTHLKISPNPLSAYAKIEFNLTSPSAISLELINLLGKPVQNILRGRFEQGTHSIQLDINKLKDMTPGIYFIQLKKSGQLLAIQKLIYF